MNGIRKGIKMRVNPEQSRKVQEICFENDIYWVTGKILKHLDKPFLFIDTDNLLSYEDESLVKTFYKSNNEEVSAELFIRTNGTCVELETTIEDNNKGEQMAELKLECLVEGYEGTYFEVGQVWETRDGLKLRVRDFNFETEIYKVTLVFKDDYELHYTKKGEFLIGEKNENDLVKLITEINESEVPTESTPSEEPQPKTLSEYLKENNAYESFIENSVETFLKDLAWYKVFKSQSVPNISLDNVFIFEDTKDDYKLWDNLASNQPENLIYDMNEIIFAEVEKRLKLKAISENPNDFLTKDEIEALPTLPKQKEQPKQEFLVYVHGKNAPKHIHDSYDSAEKEAKRLAEIEIGCNVSIVSVVKTFKSKIIVEEIK